MLLRALTDLKLTDARAAQSVITLPSLLLPLHSTAECAFHLLHSRPFQWRFLPCDPFPSCSSRPHPGYSPRCFSLLAAIAALSCSPGNPPRRFLAAKPLLRVSLFSTSNQNPLVIVGCRGCRSSCFKPLEKRRHGGTAYPYYAVYNHLNIHSQPPRPRPNRCRS
ncbi:uncharacterized protein B0H64DRAFT_194702 [Chaetomium fimeti]|uniref:Uncharacterized protein n=1 Tax=Chaetomium fimeti TaxID=1854472 RepID=A0AAE0HEE0_9PEZI|nr:hypothetical protein B0H64DRAFT_194702 [Chaetomium fimeti]